MKRFLGFVAKEVIHIWRDKRTLLILIGMPTIQILLFGFAITNEIKEADIGFFDKAQDSETRKIKDKIITSEYFTLQQEFKSIEEVENAFEQGLVKEVVIFESGFARNLIRNDQTPQIQILADATDPNTATTLINYTTAIINDYQVEVNQTSPLSPVQIIPRMVYNQQLKGVFYFIPGLITIILMLVSTMMTSISLTKEKEIGTMEVLLASPMRPYNIIFSKIIPYVVLSFFNANVILLLGYFVFKVPVRGNIWLLEFELLLFIAVALALGVLISTRAKTQQVALLISLVGLLLPTILLSGFIFPVENMPTILQVIAQIVPAKWFVIIIKNIMLKGLTFDGVLKETMILTGFLVFFTLISIKNFNVRLE